ncbi:MAG: acyl-CoA/acyl-ACP dehydrogenase [Planctomycetes bacterium]|nr:acyl-CoA/acyl-ACP dehydrogenase [Planctomycetota bacterium]
MSQELPLDDVLARAERVASVAAEHAGRVDRDAAFPDEAVAALRREGLLGLVSAREVGGLGHGNRAAALVVERLARECASTAMVTCMHYAGAGVVEAAGAEEVRRAIARGEHLSTLAFSEQGSRSHFWAPVSAARADGDAVVLDARKSWVTSCRKAAAYVWSSRPIAAEGASTLWLVPAAAPGVRPGAPFEGLGLRGNDSSPVAAEGVRVPASARLGEDGKGFDLMMGVVLPRFSLMNAACSLGLMEAAVRGAAAHVGGTRLEHANTSLADLPTIRAYVARARIETDQARALWLDTIAAVEAGREDAMLRVLETKAAAGEAALEVTDLAMRVCGGAAYRKEVGVERRFRDARAASVMAPTSDQLFDFIGKAVCGLPLFG